MADTTVLDYDNTWVTVVDDVDYLLQVRGNQEIEAFFGTLPTDPLVQGILLRPFEVISSTMLTGVLSIRSASSTKDALVSLTV